MKTRWLRLSSELEKIKQLHLDIEEKFPAWKGRVECSYLPKTLMNEVLPPKQTRPYFGGSTWYEEADYGNEWLINQYYLHHSSIALIGPEYKSLMAAPPDIREVQKARVAWAYRRGGKLGIRQKNETAGKGYCLHSICDSRCEWNGPLVLCKVQWSDLNFIKFCSKFHSVWRFATGLAWNR